MKMFRRSMVFNAKTQGLRTSAKGTRIDGIRGDLRQAGSVISGLSTARNG